MGAQRRMGFLVVFNEGEGSYREAIRLLADLKRTYLQEQAAPPIIFLVWNMSELAGVGDLEDDPQPQQLVEQLRRDGVYNIEFVQVSALELRKVKNLFRRMLVKIREKSQSWQRVPNDGERRRLSTTERAAESTADNAWMK